MTSGPLPVLPDARSRWIRVAVLAAAFGLNLALVIHFTYFSLDFGVQTYVGQRLAEGDGLTYLQADPANLSRVLTSGLNLWPPGYSILFAGVYRIFGSVELSAVIIHAGFFLIFLALLNDVLNRMAVPPAVANLAILFQGVFMNVYLGNPTDFPALTSLFAAIWLSARIAGDGRNWSRWAWLAGVAGAFGPFLRYIYFPVAALSPVLLVVFGMREKNRAIVRAGFLSGAIVVLCAAATAMFLIIYTGRFGYLMAAERGFFPAHILRVAPFSFAAFSNLNFVYLQISRWTGWAYPLVARAFGYANLIVTGLLLLPALRFLRRAWARPAGGRDFFSVAWILAGCLFFALLAALSITRYSSAAQTGRAEWMYIGDPRYFLPMGFYLFLVATDWLFSPRAPSITRWRRPLQLAFVTVLTLECAHSVYFLARRFHPFDGDHFSLFSPELRSFMRDRIAACPPSTHVVVASVAATDLAEAPRWNATPLLDYRVLNRPVIPHDAGCTVFLVIWATQHTLVDSFLRRPGLRLERQTEDTRVYSYSLP